MTGAEHYDEALRLLAEAGRLTEAADERRRRADLAAYEARDRLAGREYERDARDNDRQARRCRETAQVHATLALAAASALGAIMSTTAPYPSTSRQLAEDDHTDDAASEWHSRITIAGEDTQNG